MRSQLRSVIACAGLTMLSTAVAAAPAIRHFGMPMRHDQTAPAAVTRLLYYGGRVLTHVQVVQVLWGPNVSTTVQGLGPFYQAILQSAHIDWLGEYDTIGIPAAARLGMGVTMETEQHIGRGTFVGTVQITPTNTATSITDAQVMTEIAHQIDTGVLPQPVDDGHGGYRTLYMVDFPPGVQIQDPTGGLTCVQSCAYHSAGVYNGKNLAFGVHPDLTNSGCASGCGFGGSPLADATVVHSHELVEAITDPDIVIRILQAGLSIDGPVAWFADGNGSEIGDICAPQVAVLAGFTIQKEWSNSQGGCIIQVNGLPTCVDGQAGGCTACTSDAQCSGATSHCAMGTDVKSGECVHCVDATGCSGATPTCDKSPSDLDDTCRGCTANTDCAAPTPLCATTATGTVAAGSCVECLANSDCSVTKPLCGGAGSCTACTSDSECTDPLAPACNTDTGACEPEGAGCCSTARTSPDPSELALFGIVAVVLLAGSRRRARR